MRDERGTAITEFALVLPWLLVLLLGMIDFGKALNYWIDETHLANEGARYAAVYNWPTKGTQSLQDYIYSRVTREAPPELSGAKGTQRTAGKKAQVCIDYGTGVVGTPVTVTVKYNYDWLRYLTAQAGIGPSTQLTGTSTMRLEAKPGLTGQVCT